MPRPHRSRALLSLLIASLTAGLFPYLKPGRAADGTTHPSAEVVAPPAPPAQPVRAKYAEAYSNLPISFAADEGRARYIARGDGFSLSLSPTEAVMVLSRRGAEAGGASQTGSAHATLRMKLLGGKDHGHAAGLDELPGRVNYFIGQDARRWRTGLQTFGRVRYSEVYAGIDLVYYGNQRQLEYDFIVAPGAEPDLIRLGFDGAREVRLDEGGELVLPTAGGEVRQHKPVAYQEVGGERREVRVEYRLVGQNQVAFRLGDYDRRQPLVIDPVLSYSTYLGGSGFHEAANGIAVDPAGNAYLIGTTSSFDFPTVNALYQSKGEDAFVVKLNPAGTAVLYATYLGSSWSDAGNGIAVDAGGNAYVTGTAGKDDFPVTPDAYQTTGEDDNVFVTKLSPDGSALVYSTILSGDRWTGPEGYVLSSSEQGYAIAVNAQGEAYVTGQTQSANFPTPNHVQATPSGSWDGFVTKLTADGKGLVFSTYLGGSDQDLGRSIAVDAAGNAYVTGETYSADFTTTAGAYKTTKGIDGTDAFAVKFSPTGALAYSTFVGGDSYDTGYGVAVDGAGRAFITGQTSSKNFPATAAALKKYADAGAVFKSSDASVSWKTKSPPTQFAVSSVVLDPTNSQVVYAGGSNGVYKSTDGGETWNATDLTGVYVTCLAIDPQNSSRLLAGTGGQGIYRTSDGGAQWDNPLTAKTLRTLAINPTDSLKMYAGVSGGKSIQSTDGGDNWSEFGPTGNIRALVFKPNAPATMYAAGSAGISRSTDGGATWSLVHPLVGFTSLAINPINPQILYAGNDYYDGIYKSTDGGLNWSEIKNGLGVLSLAINPANPTIVYAGTDGSGLYKTTNSGTTWTLAGLPSSNLVSLAVDRNSPSVIYAGAVVYQADAFLTELSATGSALVYSTYLGGTGSETGQAVAVDGNGDAYVTGSTASLDFPIQEPLQPQLDGMASDAYVIKVRSGDRKVIFSTYLGGNKFDQANAIAVDAAGSIYVAGKTNSGDFPTASPLQPSLNTVEDAFVTKISGVDATPFGLSVNDVSVTEGNTGELAATFTVTLMPASREVVTVKYATGDATARAATDYTALPLSTLTFEPGQTARTVTVKIKGDTLDEPNETFRLLLSSPTRAPLADREGVCTIVDNDAAPSLKVTSLAVTETNSPTVVNFTVSLSKASAQTVTVKYQTANGTAVAPSDYQARALTTLTFLAGQTSKTIPVTIAGDSLDEAVEYFKLALSSPTNATIATGTGTCRITDNDPTPAVTISDAAAVTEPDTGARVATFTVKLSAASGQTVTVKFQTAGGTATSGTDFGAVALTTLAFLPGQTSKTVTVQVKGDLAPEPDETFFVNLSAPVNATIADTQGLGTILNDD